MNLYCYQLVNCKSNSHEKSILRRSIYFYFYLVKRCNFYEHLRTCSQKYNIAWDHKAYLLRSKTKFNFITLNAFDKLFTVKHLLQRKYR